MTGKKTYIIVAVALAYLLGSKLGWWTLDPALLAALGALAAAFLRSAISNAAAPLLLGCALLLFSTGAGRAQETVFRRGEVAVESFASTTTADLKHYRMGYGIGAGYSYHENWSVGMRLGHDRPDVSGTLISDVGLRLTARLPLKSMPLAPYTFIGPSYSLRARQYGLSSGVGAEYRFTKNFGIFAEAGLNSSFTGRNHFGGAAGLKFIF